MKASIRRKYGSAEKIKIENVEQPVPKDDEVLVKVFATTVNRTDCAVLTGKPFIMRLFTGLINPKLIIPGTDFAGEIIAKGKNVQSFSINDKVFGFKDDGLASQAEYMTISEKGNILTIPGNSSYKVAAASVEGAHYAYNFINKVYLKNGQKVLINGATGAIGSALLQLVKQYDITVTAVCNSKNIELIKSLGADKIFDYTKEDFTEANEEYDFIFDAVGKSTFGKCKSLLKKGGVYISSELGPNAENPFLAMTTSFIGDKKVIFPFPSDVKGSMIFIKKLVENKKFKPVIEKEYSLEDISEAYNYVCSGQKTGNVIINIAASS